MVTNWKSSLETGHDLVVAKYLCMICLGAIVVDFAHSFRFDYNLLFRSEDKTKNESKRIKWPQVCYLLCKFFYLPYWTVTFVREPSYRVNCQITITISEVLMGVITCLCSALLAFRVLCIWQHRCGNMFKIALLLLWLGLLAVWMIGVRDVTGTWVKGIGSPWVKDQGACKFDPIPFRYAGKFVATVVFDSLILMLTIVGVMKARIKTRLGAILMEQGTIYVVLTVCVNVMLVSFAWSDLNDVMTVILSIPAQTISVMTATRLYVLLRLETTSGHQPFGSNSSLPSFSSPDDKLLRSGSSTSFPTYIINSSRHLDSTTTAHDTMLTPKTSYLDINNGSKGASARVDNENQHNVEKSKSLIKLSYDERDPFAARRPETSPASKEQDIQRRCGPSVFIHETYSVVSEPTPAHLKELPILPSLPYGPIRPSTVIELQKE